MAPLRVQRVPPRQHVGVSKPSTKPIGSSTAPVDRHGFRGDTIIALPPHRHPMKALCLGDGDREAAARELARKLFKIRFADSDGRRRSASFLVQRRYAWRGYQVDAPAAIQPSRITLSAYDGDDVVATISVGLDTGNELFVNALFGDEVNSLRARGGKVCEFTKLAIEEAIKSKAVIAALFHTAYIHARRISSCTDLVVEVNPRHVLFYQRMLGFTVLGPTRADPRVQAPATLLHLDLGHAEAEIAKLGGKRELAAQGRSLVPAIAFRPKDEARHRAAAAVVCLSGRRTDRLRPAALPGCKRAAARHCGRRRRRLARGAARHRRNRRWPRLETVQREKLPPSSCRAGAEKGARRCGPPKRNGG